jgi:hypothetical protein
MYTNCFELALWENNMKQETQVSTNVKHVKTSLVPLKTKEAPGI